MIPLGSCTMKLNATSRDDAGDLAGVRRSCTRSRPPSRPRATARCSRELESWLAEITGFAAVSLQPNAGSQGEYAGLLAIRAYHESARRGAAQRLPDPGLGARHQPGERGDGGLQGRRRRVRRRAATSTSPTCARKAEEHADELARADGHLPVDARRVRGGDPRDLRDRPRARRPGVHGRREHERAGRAHAARRRSAPTSATSTCTRPSASRTAAAARAWGRSRSRSTSRRSCPAIPSVRDGRRARSVRCRAAPWGSASILPISWVYIAHDGRRRADAARPRSRSSTPTTWRSGSRRTTRSLYTGKRGRVAHEFILDCRGFEKSAASRSRTSPSG